MTKYLFKRLLHGLFSAIAIVAIVMTLVYSLMDRKKIFMNDTDFSKRSDNLREIYMQERWEIYGYLDYVNFKDYVAELVNDEKITRDEQKTIIQLGDKVSQDSSVTKKYVEEFTKYYESKGYKVVRLNAVTKSMQSSELYATKDIPVLVRVVKYFAQIIFIDNIHYVDRHVKTSEGFDITIEDKGLKFTLFDPVYNTSEGGYKLSVTSNGVKNYIACSGSTYNLVTDASKASLFQWSQDYKTFCTINADDLKEYGFGNQDGKLVYGRLDSFTNTDKVNNIFHLETLKQFYSAKEPFDFTPYTVLETYINNKVYVEKKETYSLFTSTSENSEVTKTNYLTFDGGKLTLTNDSSKETGIGFEVVEGGQNLKKVLSPAIIGNGTKSKYILYFDNQFPFVHQNLIKLNLGKSYSIARDIEITEVLFNRQDPLIYSRTVFETGHVEVSPKNLHSVVYINGSRTALITNEALFVDDYASCGNIKSNKSKTGFSFVIGVISTILSYFIGVPLGILMARNKNGLLDKLGTVYIIFIIAVPSLAYILMFKSIGVKAFKLPAQFNATELTTAMYILPIISLGLPSVAGLMKWLRRYMIDQMNSDYVKFARSGGLSEGEIFSKHILKNAIIPIVHGIPGALIGAVAGAIITESIYLVPGAGYLLTSAINSYDNAVIVGLTLFYACLSIIGLIAGDILMAMVDPRISFTDKAR